MARNYQSDGNHRALALMFLSRLCDQRFLGFLEG